MLIRARPRAGWWTGLTLSVLFAVCMVPLATFDLFGRSPLVTKGKVTSVTGYTVRLPEVGIYRDLVSPPTMENRRLVFAHGDELDHRDVGLVAAYEAGRRPPQLGLLLGLGIAYFLMGLLFTAYLRNFGHRGALLRTQIVLLALTLATAALAKSFFLLTPLPAFLFPIGAISICIAALHDRQTAFATTVVASMLIGSLVPFDLVASLVLLMQGFGAVLTLRRPPKPRNMVLAGVGGGTVAASIYVAYYFLLGGRLPEEDFSSPVTSGLVSAALAGPLGGLLSLAVAPLLARALGQLSRARLLELADLNQPLLRQIASKAPGTWAHSLAMSNMAEVAATAIGADALLTRVGAYYHDLGKSIHPEYYIENLTPGGPSPHDAMEPEASAQAIFSHCAEGVRLGRGGSVPEPVLDFMHMHHGNGLLEYFFHKNQAQGNPRGLTERDFRYPGIPPQTKETAILAICDAVEAASRTLKEPDERTVSNLVQRIVFGKLRLGQLDESGLTSLDLKKLSTSLIEVLKSSFHVRIEYPWQREERAAGRSEAVPEMEPGPSMTQRLSVEPLLDSADAPRPGPHPGGTGVRRAG